MQRKNKVEFIDETMPNDLSDYDKEHWFYDKNDYTLLQNIDKLPKGYAIVRSGRTKIGDILCGWCEWGHSGILTEETHKQALNCEVGHFHGVARLKKGGLKCS